MKNLIKGAYGIVLITETIIGIIMLIVLLPIVAILLFPIEFFVGGIKKTKGIVLFLRKHNLCDMYGFYNCSLRVVEPTSSNCKKEGCLLRHWNWEFKDCKLQYSPWDTDVSYYNVKITVKYVKRSHRICREFSIYCNGMIVFFCRDQVRSPQLLIKEIKLNGASSSTNEPRYVNFTVVDGDLVGTNYSYVVDHDELEMISSGYEAQPAGGWGLWQG